MKNLDMPLNASRDLETILKKVVAFLREGKMGWAVPGVRALRRIGGGGQGDVYLLEFDTREKVPAKLVVKLFRQTNKYLTSQAILEEYGCLERFSQKIAMSKAEGIGCPKPWLVSTEHLFYAMEYLEGTDLPRVLDEQRVVDPRDIAQKMARGLHMFYQANGRFFSDFSENNVRIDTAGSVCFLDPTTANPDYASIKQKLAASDSAADIGYWMYGFTIRILGSLKRWRPTRLLQRYTLSRELFGICPTMHNLDMKHFQRGVRAVATAHWDRLVRLEHGAPKFLFGRVLGRIIVKGMTRQ